MNKEELLDLLRRAYEMEEVMSADLIDLSSSQDFPEGIPDNVKKRLQATLNSIKEDTLRHKKIVSQMLEAEK